MHDATVVVFVAKTRDNRAPILIEVALRSWTYVSIVDFYILVSIRSALLMEESQGMKKFMDNCATVHATIALKVQLLNSRYTTDIRPTSAVVICNVDVVPA